MNDEPKSNKKLPQSPSSTTGSNKASTTKPTRKKWRLLKRCCLIIGIPLIILTIGLLVWYYTYYNNKQVVVRDALYSLLQDQEDTSNYTITVDKNDQHVKLTGTASYLANGSKNIDLDVTLANNGVKVDLGQFSLTTSGNNMYLKLKLSKLFAQSGIDTTSLDDQWLELDSSDLDNLIKLTGAAESISVSELMKCSKSGSSELDSRANQQQIVGALLDSNFLIIETNGGDQSGQIYQLSLDANHYGDFIKQFVASNYYQSAAGCLYGDSSKDIAKKTASSKNIEQTSTYIKQANPTIKLWINRWSHQLAKLYLSTDSAGAKMGVTIDYAHKVPTINLPSKAKPIKDLLGGSLSPLKQVLASPETIAN